MEKQIAEVAYSVPASSPFSELSIGWWGKGRGQVSDIRSTRLNRSPQFPSFPSSSLDLARILSATKPRCCDPAS